MYIAFMVGDFMMSATIRNAVSVALVPTQIELPQLIQGLSDSPVRRAPPVFKLPYTLEYVCL